MAKPLALTIDHLQAFLEVAERRSIQSAARESGRSRATYARVLADLRSALGASELLDRAPGRRVGRLTPQGEELARRATRMVEIWQRWVVSTRDALETHRTALRVGTLPGSFDLIAELLTALRLERPALALRIVEYPDERLLSALELGAVDLGFATLGPDEPPPRLAFEPLGSLPWAVIVPREMARRFPARVRLRDLDGVPLVVTRGGPARARLEWVFAEHADGPLTLNAAYEVGSTPRLVEMVDRGFAPALVSRFRLAFVPKSVEVRPLVDGPPPLTAGVFTRHGAKLPPVAKRLITAARRRFRELTR